MIFYDFLEHFNDFFYDFGTAWDVVASKVSQTKGLGYLFSLGMDNLTYFMLFMKNMKFYDFMTNRTPTCIL